MNNEALVERFLRISEIEKNLSPRTLKAYRCDLRTFTVAISPNSLLEIEIAHLRDYLTSLASSKLAPSTIKRKLATLKVFFSVLEQEGLVDDVPTRKLRWQFRVPQHIPRVMSTVEVKALLQAVYVTCSRSRTSSGWRRIKVFRDRAILELLYCTGIRSDEAIRLNTSDIDLERNTLHITGKGRKERLLYISCDEVMDAIREYLRLRAEIITETGAVFLNRFGRRLSVHSIRTIFSDYLDKAGITRRFTPHCLRHTMATMLIENGADVRSVQEILGHSQISTTEIYIAVSRHRKKEVLSRFNQRNQLQLR